MASVARWCCCGVECQEINTAFTPKCTHCAVQYLLDAVTSGITTPAACYDQGDGSSLEVVSGNVNGSGNMAVDGGDSCINRVGVGNLLMKDHAFVTDCSSGTGGVGASGVALTRTATQWICQVNDGTGEGICFYDVQAADADNCEVVPAFTNDLVIGDLGSSHGPTGLTVVGYGGAATIVCRPVT